MYPSPYFSISLRHETSHSQFVIGLGCYRSKYSMLSPDLACVGITPAHVRDRSRMVDMMHALRLRCKRRVYTTVTRNVVDERSLARPILPFTACSPWAPCCSCGLLQVLLQLSPLASGTTSSPARLSLSRLLQCLCRGRYRV